MLYRLFILNTPMYAFVLLVTATVGSTRTNSTGVETRQISCCTQDLLTNSCQANCFNKFCTELCTYRCGPLNIINCGSFWCLPFKPSCATYKSALAGLRQQSGRVLEGTNTDYETNRKVFNAACTAKPAFIVLPNTERDVSIILRTAAQYNYTISVRSGGHSYTCNSLKDGSIHIVMSNFNQIALVISSESETGLAAWLGTGARWGNVLRTIPNTVYSYPHGQCKSVGVGGFLLGGGVNWLGTYNKYGYGAEHIIKMSAVLADGNIVNVDMNKTVYTSSGKTVIHTPDNNLFFGLRGAGSSLAIVTSFLYTIHREPETRPAIILIWIKDATELENFYNVIGRTNKYSFMINEQISALNFWTSQSVAPLMAVFPFVMDALKLNNGKTVYPLQVMVTDMTLGVGMTTSPVPAVQFLKANGVDILVDNYLNAAVLAPLLGGSASSGTYFLFDRFANSFYEAIENEQESWQPSTWSTVSLNYGSLRTTKDFASVFINDPNMGIGRKSFQQSISQGCSFCFWMIHFRNRQWQTQISKVVPISTRTDRNEKTSVEMNLTCMFPPSQTTCVNVVNSIKATIASNLAGQSYSKYYNFPSCSPAGTDWRSLYWGTNVPQLMKIKSTWDTNNTFFHCQSLTSTNTTCCPFTSGV